MSYAATFGGRQQGFAGAAIIGGRQQGFAGFGDATSDANAAFTELDAYGGPTVAPTPGTSSSSVTATSASGANSTAPSPLVTAPASITVSQDSSQADFNSWFPGLVQQVIQAGTTIATDAIGANAPPPPPPPMPAPTPDVLGIPLPLVLLGGALFLFSR